MGKAWTMVRDAETIKRDENERAKAEAEMLGGVYPCVICGRKAKVRTFGLLGRGVWVGCDATFECSRHIEIHTEGWSTRECIDEWNRYNSGCLGMFRKIHTWWRRWRGSVIEGGRVEDKPYFMRKPWEIVENKDDLLSKALKTWRNGKKWVMNKVITLQKKERKVK